MIAAFQQVVGGAPNVTLFTAFAAGTATSLGLCAVIRLPIVLAYVTGAADSKRHGIILSILFALGLIAGTVALGFAAGSAEEDLRGLLHMNRYLFWVLGIGLFVAGVLLSGLINPHLLPEKWQRVSQRLTRTGSPGAFLLGCAFGLLQMPACPNCGNAIEVLGGAAAGSSLSWGLALYVGFAAGQGVMMLSVGVLTSLLMPGLLRALRTRMCSVEPRIQLLAGNTLMVLGIYFVLVS